MSLLELVVHLRGDTLVFPLPQAGVAKVGRARESDVRIDDASVSRDHFVLHIGETVELEDLGSSNGTQVFSSGNQSEAREETLRTEDNWYVEPGKRVTLEVGDVIRIGAVPCIIQSRGRDSNEGPPQARVSRPPAHTADPILADPEMKRIYELAKRASHSDICVLILGDTGVGKELLAETIHVHSPRATGQFLRLNCIALSDSLLESELFGHERGAFTGATHARVGLLESTSGGTVLLDEIGEMPPQTQAKLLRVLEERRIMRVGATRSRAVDVRFIAATNRDLEREVANGRFRGDLYYRISGIQLRIPPLRERPSEIVVLARYFLKSFCYRSGVPVPEVTPEAEGAMLAYSWPGNVRELKNAMERAPFLSAGAPILPEHLPQDTDADPFPSSEITQLVENRPVRSLAPLGRTVPPPSATTRPARGKSPAPSSRKDPAQAERQRIARVLDQCGGNQTRAAKRLGISRRTLINRLESLGMPRPRKRTQKGT
jgi:DNA-binding NtrC family response regulator